MRFSTIKNKINWIDVAAAWGSISPMGGVFYSPDGAIYGPDGATLQAPRQKTTR
jgi:hypothetical protein